MNVVVCGFTPFGPVQMNPSQIVVEEVASRHRGRDFRVHARVLDTAYASAGETVRTLIRSLRPDLVLLTGVAPESNELSIERFALNCDDCSEPDNSGDVRIGKPIIGDGPVAYRSTLPVDALCRHLNEKELPARASNHAGTYVCNHVFYIARHEIQLSGLPSMCGFIHLPMPRAIPVRSGSLRQLSIHDLVTAIELAVQYLVSVVSV